MGLVRTSARQTPLTPRRWTRLEYERLIGLGMFEGEPLELLDGQLVVAEPQYPYHASAVTRADYAIRGIYRSVTTLAPPATVAPRAFPACPIAVADLLPSRPA